MPRRTFDLTDVKEVHVSPKPNSTQFVDVTWVSKTDGKEYSWGSMSKSVYELLKIHFYDIIYDE